jgi:CubicO group peptidase (beta-lactamase class C family)
MMHKSVVLLFLTLLTSFVGFAQNIDQKIDRLYQCKNDEPGFSIAVYQADEILVEKQYGNANLSFNIPVSEETVFDIGSIGKQFTAAAILLLEEQGKLSIQDPVYKYVHELPRYQKGDPTIEQLLNQTSGIKEVDNYLEVCDVMYSDYISQSMVLNIITNIDELYFTPGEHFYYTNANYILLASVVENITGVEFEEFLQEQIFEPLDMQHTYVNRDAFRVIPNRAIGYTESEGQYYQTHQYGLHFLGDGQVITNPRDMFKWHQNLKHATIGTPELWRKMHTKAKLNNGNQIDYGLGVEFEEYNGIEAMGFDGMITSGFVSKYLYFPTLDLAFFSTQNTFDWEFKDRYFELIDLFVSNSYQKKDIEDTYRAVNVSNDKLKEYEGQYVFYKHDEERKANEIKLHRGKLQVWTLDGDEIAELIPLGNDQFLFGRDGDAIVTFHITGTEKYYTYDELENELPWRFNQFEPYEHTALELQSFQGVYYNKELQLIKELRFENDRLYLTYRNGAWKYEVNFLSKDLLEISISPFELVRNQHNAVIGFELMGLYFEKIN